MFTINQLTLYNVKGVRELSLSLLLSNLQSSMELLATFNSLFGSVTVLISLSLSEKSWGEEQTTLYRMLAALKIM